jgi:hypothetical protein
MTAVLVSVAQPEVSSPAPRRARLVASAPRAQPAGVLVRIRPAGPDRYLDDLVDQWGMQSFPASDPPANW